jgi:hypothetical protein
MSSIRAIQAASQITVAYCGVYSLTLLNQLVHKKLLHAQYCKEGKVFDRYTAIEMRPIDRINANMLEWMPIFLGPLWILALNSNQGGGSGAADSGSSLLTDTCVTVSWMYVGFRVLYFALVLKYGVSSVGRNIPLYAATFPGYACLVYLMTRAVMGVY